MRKRALLLAGVLLAVANAGFARADDLDAAIASGDFASYFAGVTASLNRRTPASEDALMAVLKEPAFRRMLDQRHLLAKHGVERVGAFAKADPGNRRFLAWLLRNTTAMDLYLESAVPTGLAARDEDTYTLDVTTLAVWKRILDADPAAKEGLLLKLAIATAAAPPGSGNHGAGQREPFADPVDRYQHFKAARANKELFPSFDKLTVWEYEKVVSSCASDGDLAWARQMLNTWRPDLRADEQVVNSTSEVQYRTPAFPYTDGYKSVIAAGGKCGPRSSWGVMICQAFGIPAIGVLQPGHACIAYKAHDPSLQPQPGSVWKIAYGRGWQFSRLEGLSGPDFLAGVAERSRATEFSQVEHLRWLASALTSRERAAAVMALGHKIQRSAPAASADLSASEKAAEAEKETSAEGAVPKAPAAGPRAPIRIAPAGTRVEAAAFSGMSGVRVYDCYTGGRQVNFQKNMESSWVEYRLDVPETGTYTLALTAATPNNGQVLAAGVDAGQPTTIEVPNTTGLWGVTPAVAIRLEMGIRTLRLTAPYQRGIALRWLDLKLRPSSAAGNPNGKE